MSKIQLMKAEKAHLAFLMSLRKKTMVEHLNNAGISMNDEQHKECIIEFFSDSFIIQKNGLAIGLLKLSIDSERIHIRQFQLLPEFHNKGIGTQLLLIVQRRAQQLSIPITLNVLVHNPAKSLYLRHGFNVIGQDEHQYQMRWSKRE